MKLKIFALRDIQADTFGNPFYLPTHGSAIRQFADEINRKEPNNQLNAHPEDFTLHELGEYDSDTGLFSTHSPDQIATGKSLYQ